MSLTARVREMLSRHLPAGSIRRRFASSSFWSLVGTALAQSLSLLASIVTARLLGKDGFGELGIVLSTVTMFTTLGSMGLGLTATKHIADFRLSDPQRTGRVAGMSLVVALISGGAMAGLVVIFAPYLAEHAINAPQLTPELRLASLILLFSALNGTQVGALCGFEAFSTMAVVQLVPAVLSFPLMIAGVYYWKLPGAVGAQVAMTALALAASSTALSRQMRKTGVKMSFKNMRGELGIIWSFSMPLVLSSLTVAFVTWAAAALLVNQPGGFAEMGIFRAANQWRAFLLFIPQILSVAVTPIMANTFSSRQERSTVKIMAASMGLNLAIIIVPGLLLGALSPWIMGQYGEGFRQGWPVLLMCLVTAGFVAFLSPVGNILVASGRMWVAFFMNLGWSALLMLLTFALLPKGALGLSIAYAGAYLAHAIWVTSYAVWLIKKVNPDVLKFASAPATPKLES